MARNTKEFYGEGKETWKHLEKITNRGHNNHQVFGDWLDILLCAFQYPHREKQYLEIIGKYKDKQAEGKRSVDYFMYACRSIEKEMKEKQCDILGNIFEQKVSYGNNGQFLTPEPLCKLTAQFTVTEGQQSIADPACGSGRMLLAAGEINPEAHLYGKDIDPLCAKMTALNLVFNNLTGIVEHGDTLRHTLYAVWLTQKTIFGGVIRQLDEAELEAYKKRSEKQLMNCSQSEQQNKPSTPEKIPQNVPMEGEVLEEPATPLEEMPSDGEPEQPPSEISEGQLAEIRQAQEFGVDPMRFDEQQRLAEESQNECEDLPLFASQNG